MTTMQAFIFTDYSKPTPEAVQKGIYTVTSVPKPAPVKPDDILIRVHAAAINPVDCKTADGSIKLVVQEQLENIFPCRLGLDCSGVVEAIGSGVTKFVVGDAVISRVHRSQKGTFAEYVVSSEDITTKKPSNLSHVEASCLPLAGMTALQSIRRMNLTDKPAPRSLFIPAALGGVGSLAIQLARHHFKIEKIVTTVSTAKVAQTEALLAGADLEIIDYRKSDPIKGREGTMDGVFDCVGEAAAYMPLLKANEPPAAPSQMVSVATAPDGEAVCKLGGSVPWLVKQVLNFKDWRLRSAAEKRKSIYSYLMLEENAPDLQVLVDLAEQGLLKPVVGKTFPLASTPAALRAAAAGTVTGKVVVEVIPNGQSAAASATASSSSSSSSSTAVTNDAEHAAQVAATSKEAAAFEEAKAQEAAGAAALSSLQKAPSGEAAAAIVDE